MVAKANYLLLDFKKIGTVGVCRVSDFWLYGVISVFATNFSNCCSRIASSRNICALFLFVTTVYTMKNNLNQKKAVCQ